MSLYMAESCVDYLTSYVLDDDMVARLSLESMENLRDDILATVARIKVTKYQAMNAKRSVEIDKLLHPRDRIPPTEFSTQLQGFHEHQLSKKECLVLNIPLYLPGKIVHLVSPVEDDGPSGCCSGMNQVDMAFSEGQQPYSARWAHREDLAEVIISSHSINDHRTDNVQHQLERVAGCFGLSSPFCFEQPHQVSEKGDHTKRI